MVFVENRVDRSIPASVEENEQFFRKNTFLRQNFFKRLQEDAFILTIAVQASACLEAGLGNADNFTRKFENRAGVGGRLQTLGE